MSFFLLFSWIGAAAQDSWKWLNPRPSGLPTRHIAFLDAQTGFILNDQELYQTKDGGATWQYKGSGGQHLAFRGNQGAIASGQGVYVSSDRGESWRYVSLTVNPEETFHSVQVVAKDTIYAFNQRFQYRSFDGGVHWTGRASRISSDHPSQHAMFVSSHVGYISDDDGRIAKTVDGGATWNVKLSGPGGFRSFDFLFVNEQKGYAFDSGHSTQKTVDGGETWQTIPSIASYTFSALFFQNESVGYAGTEDGDIYKTQDGGTSWSSMEYSYSEGARNVYALYFFNENKGMAAGGDGWMIQTNDAGQHWTQNAVTYSGIYNVSFPSNATGYIFSDKIYKTTDRGATWVPLTTGLDEDNYLYENGYFLSDNLGFARARAGGVYSLLRTADGGAHWTPTGIGASYVSFISAAVGYASGDDDGIFKTTDGGLHWERVGSFKGQLHFITESKGFAIKYNDLYQTTDGGVTWTVRQTHGGWFTDIFFADANTGYVSAEQGVIYKTSDGGVTWKMLSIGSYASVKSVAFRTPDVGVVVDDYLHSYFTTNGGDTWKEVSVPVVLANLAVTPEGRVYGVTGGGRMLVYDLSDSNPGPDPDPGTVTHIDESISDMVRLSPNPTNTHVTVECAEGIEQIVLFDPLGRKQFHVVPGTRSYLLPMDKYPSGIYVVRIESRGKTFVRKIVKE
jgi:photosystem II stability/assembly factor-like uncharacterized protein